MGLGTRNKVDPAFNMSSMTDMVFLLLIFFMLTSNFVVPSGLPINLPTSGSASKVMRRVSVAVTSDLRYFVNQKQVSFNNLEAELKTALAGSDEGVVVLDIDKSVPVQHLVSVAGIATKLNAKVSIATKPD